ncbi:sickle tail protein homolog isoform X2 [Electrophorus electricus]|uniref:sickle tail protein homolog isoform X2 n=1 Tax=Electrophorus electricus TaxID=8005 RepID=UPI0015CFCB75|nr:sickle tail protein homolog isoform X2 [Electrophorus electricus]
MQPHNAERRREAFLEHLKQKYPHHASTIMSLADRIKEQISGNPQHFGGKQGDQQSLASLESLQAMSEEVPSTFTRGSRTRASLPVVKSSNQTKDRSLGVLYLQYGEETRQALMPNEVTSADTVRALFVSAFPQQLTLKMLESPNVAIYIKDHVRNVYYELTDIRNITAHSCLKVYHKDPAQAFNHSPLNSNGDARLSRYSGRQQAGGQSMLHTLPPPHSPIHTVQGSMSPPSGRSMPPSPSRFPYGMAMPASATLPRDRLSSVPITRSAPPCSSAILERRDVKPDEDVSGRGAPLYADPYTLPEARLSVASSHGTQIGDMLDGQVFLQRRSQAKSVGSYAEVADPQHSLYRQRSRKYSESPHMPLGSKSPPSSPQRVGEVRMIDIHPGQNAHMLLQGAERTVHARRSFRKDSNGTMEAVARVRGTVASPVFVDLPHGHGDRPFQGPISTEGPQSERMKAMEQQIASLTGLLQHALLKGTNTSGIKENASEKSSEPLAHGTTSGGVSPIAGSKSPVLQALPPQARGLALGPLLDTFQRNVSSLRMHLHQLRQTQVQNQEVVRVMLQQAEEELTDRVCEQLRLLDDPMQKQRKQVEQERHRYVSMEENLLLQLGELENHVERLKKDSAQQPITLRDVEEGAVNLRTVGECLAALKGEFPALQLKMRSVLRVEVEAVRFLKEEPHKMDSMLKRVKGLTETLSDLQSCATESHALVDPVAPVSLTTTKESDSPDTSRSSPGPQPLSPARSELTPSSPVVVHQACSSPVNLQPCQHSVSLSHQPSPPLTPVSGRDSPTVAKVSPRSREDSTALQKKEASAGQERPMDCSSVTSCPPQHEETGTGKDKLQVAEKEQAEQMEEAVGTEMERKLRQAQDSLMESIPNLEVTQEESSSPSPATCLPDKADSSCPPPPLPEAATLAEPADKPVKISVEGGQKPAIEKPLRVKPSPETASKSPPPPPPRRFHPPATGLTTGRSGEVIYTTHKESIFVQQQDGEEATPQAKLQRVPPEVKPKPHISTPIHASAAHDEGEGDKDKIVAELQNIAQHSNDGQQSPKTAKSGSGVIYYITGKSRPPSDNAPSGPGEQNQSSEGIISSLKVAVLNPSDPSPWPNILTSHDLTLDSSKQEKENQKETSDTEQMSACFVEALKDSCKAEDDTHVLAPKEELPEAVTDRLEEQVSSHASELPITVTEEPVKTCVVGEDQTDSQVLPGPPALSLENGLQEVVWSSSREQDRHTEQDRRTEQDNLIPDVPRETDSPDRFAFVITKTKVQALSTGEYRQLVSSKGQDVETVQVGADTTDSAPEDSGSGKKPVIIVFDEPMDIQQAYKRLSTIFECEEELDRMLSKERIDEEVEDAEEEDARSQMTREIMPIAEVAGQLRPERNPDANGNVNHLPVPGEQNKNTEDSTPQLEDGSKVEPNDTKQEGKKKFKFPFPKKQLAAIGQALRTGTKAGKKTLQVVVYEDEEEDDGTLKKAKEAKRFEITSTTDSAGAAPSANTAPAADTPSADAMSQNHTVSSQSPTRSTNEICKSTYKTLDSLEETIKQLETTISNMEPGLSPETSRKDPKSKRTAVQTAEGKGSPSKRPAPLGPKPQKPPQRKNSKALSVPHPPTPNSPGSADPKQNIASSPSSSRITSPKARPQAGSVEKAGKPPKLQDSQRQYRQVVLL